MGRRILKAFRVGAVRELPVSFDLQFPVFPEGTAARLQLLDPPKYPASGRAPGTQQENFCRARHIDGRPEAGVFQNGLQLRGKEQPSPLFGIKQGLHPDPVAGQEQPLCPVLPDGEGIDAVELFQNFPTPLGVAVEEHLRVRMAFEPVAQLHKAPAELSRIVKLPIINDGVFLVFIF